jgi:hypothetical protein
LAKTNASSARIAQAREREQKAMELRKAGKSYSAIASALSVSDAAAYKMVKRCLARLERISADDAAEMRRLETERIDAMLAAYWESAVGREASTAKETLPDGTELTTTVEAVPPDPEAAALVLKLQARRASLWGLDAPAKQENTVSGEVVVKVLGQDQSMGDL